MVCILEKTAKLNLRLTDGHSELISRTSFGNYPLFGQQREKIDTKVITYYERPKMKFSALCSTLRF